MSDPSSAFLAAAFAAGIIEGSSVLRHYRAVMHNDAASSISTPCLAAHIFLYGTVALPLGMVGASPGVAFYPRSFKASIDEPETTNDHHEQSLEKYPEPVKAVEAGVSRNSEVREAFVTSAHSPPVTGTGRGIGRILREENLKKIMHSSTNNHPHHRELGGPNVDDAFVAERNLAPAAPRPNAFLFSEHTPLSRYVSTLDGRSLPTPFSEAMRRSRCLFIGAALASMAITQYLSTDHRNKAFQPNECIDYGSIVDENGSIDRTHDCKLKRRLRADIASEIERHRDSINDKVFSLHLIQNRAKSSSEKAQMAVLNGVCYAIDSLEKQFERSLDFPPFNWFFQWKKSLSCSQDDQGDSRPIAIRLIMNDDKMLPLFPSTLCTDAFWSSPFPWLSMTKKEENACCGRQKHDSFFVLPLFTFSYKGLPHHLKKLSHPWWIVDFEPKPFKELPINSSWLLNNYEMQGVNVHYNTVDGALSDSSTHSTGTSSSRLLVIEANVCPSIHDVLRRRYTEKSSHLIFSDGLASSGRVVALARMLMNLARNKCLDNSKSVTTATVLIHNEDKVVPTDEDQQTWNQCICFDALDLLKWALLASINNICKSHEQADKVVPGNASSENTSQASGIDCISDAASPDKNVATLWTIVDVLGTSIRHLFQSTYRIASAAAFLRRKRTQLDDRIEHTANFPQMIQVVSSCRSTTNWLEECLNNSDWKVSALQQNNFSKNEILSGGILFILGKSDLDTCELASSIIRSKSIWRDPNTKVLILLEDPSMCETIRASINLVECSQELTSNTTAIADKVTVLCASCVYEFAFAVVRSFLSGETSTDVERQLERIFLK